MLEDEQGVIYSSEEEIEKEWLKYVEELYKDDNRKPMAETTGGQTAPEITMSELEAALRKAKRRRAVGQDEIPVDVLKILSENGKKVLLKILNKIYKKGILPNDFKISTFIPLPKKVNAKKCEQHRTISLMSHTLKILLAIINRRIEARLDAHLNETQFGFVSNRGTRDAIVMFKIMIQRALAVNRELFLCFIDYEKAFDKVQHEKLVQILQKYQIDGDDMTLICNLYWQQEANIRTSTNRLSRESVEIKRGVRQGCPISPRLFNIYSEEITRHPRIQNTGFKIHGERIGSISYADDKVLIAETPQQLQRMVDRLNKESRKLGMKMNIGKTKIMRISRDKIIRPLNITVDNSNLEQVKKYTYLGVIITEDGRDEEEIKVRLAKARSAFNNMERVLRDHNIRTDVRIRILWCYVWSIARYASETWIITNKVEKKINAFEMWGYRRMLKIKWTEKVRNEEVLQRLKLSDRMLLPMILHCKRKFLESKAHNDRLFKVVTEGKIAGKAGKGRRRSTTMSTI